eukprot:44175-Prymnesium_polylepis.1
MIAHVVLTVAIFHLSHFFLPVHLDDWMIGKRIEVIFHYTLPEGFFGNALIWCAGEIVGLDPRPYTTFPKGKSALVKWDANNRVEPAEKSIVQGTKLLPSK